MIIMPVRARARDRRAKESNDRIVGKLSFYIELASVCVCVLWLVIDSLTRFLLQMIAMQTTRHHHHGTRV